MKSIYIYTVIWLASLAGLWSYTQLEADFAIDVTGLGDADDREARAELLSQFNSWDTNVVVMLQAPEPLHAYRQLLAIQAVSDTLASWSSIRYLTSITRFDFAVWHYLGPRTEPFLPLADSLAFYERWEHLDQYPDITEKFISEDRRWTTLYLTPESSVAGGLSGDSLQEFLESDLPGWKVLLMGAEVTEKAMADAATADMLRISVLAIVLLFASYFLLTRSRRTLLPVLSFVVFNCSAVFSFMFITGFKITLLTATVPAIVAILSFSDLLHILSQYRQLTDEGVAPDKARWQLFRTIGRPLILTSLSNLIGFLLFLFIGHAAYLNELAMVAGFGIVFSYFSSRLLAPLVLQPDSTEGLFRQKAHYLRWLLRVQEHVARYLRWYVLATLLLTGWLGWDMGQQSPIDMRYYDSRDSAQTYVQSFLAFDRHFQGVRDIEVVLTTRDDPFDAVTLEQIEKISNYLEDSYGCTSVYSWNTVLKRYNRFRRQGAASQYVLPQRWSDEMQTALLEHPEATGMYDVVTQDFRQYRIIGSLPDIGTREANSRKAALETYLTATLPPEVGWEISGAAFVFDRGVTRFTESIGLALLLSLLAIGIIMGALARSLRVVVLTIWVNGLPLLLAWWLLWQMGIALNPQSVFLLTIILGVALDDSIYITGYFSGNKRPDFHTQVVRRLAFPVGVTTGVLAISFLALCFSTNPLIAAFGWITCTSLLLAFLLDLLLLPLIIQKRS